MYGELDDLLNEVEGALADEKPAKKSTSSARGGASWSASAGDASTGASSRPYKGGRAAARFSAARDDAASASQSRHHVRSHSTPLGHSAAPHRETKARDEDDLEALLSMVQSASPTRGNAGSSSFGTGVGAGSGAGGAGSGSGSMRSSSFGGVRTISENSGLATSHGNKKCGTVYVGGSACPMGRSRPGVRRDRVPVCCDNLRCTSCDFTVLRLANRKWDSKADYMFFRNYMPDADKISTLAVRSQGGNAYCCQCTWKAVVTPTKLTELETYWVCSGHSQ